MRLAVLLLSFVLPLWAVPAAAAPGAEQVVDPGACEVELALTLDEDASPIGLGPCPGVRPGAYVQTRSEDGSSGCSFNFVFDGYRNDGVERVLDGRYIGTAGHCAVDEGDEVSWAPGDGPTAHDSEGELVGHYVYAINDGNRDIALIKLLPDVESNPQMCHFGGPTDLNNDITTSSVELQHFGQGLVLGDTIPGRTAVAERMGSPDNVHAMGAAIFGDSGSGVISADGRAVGVVVTIGVHSGNQAGTGFVGITRLAPQLELATAATGVEFELVTAEKLV